MAVQMISDITSQGHTVGTLIMDNDSKTIDKVRDINPNILTLSDSNHTRKSISNALYNLAKEHSAL